MDSVTIWLLVFEIFMFESVLKISEHVEICNACWKHIEKECWKL